MKSLKKTLVLLVVLSMLLSAISPVFAANYFADEAEIAEAYLEHANKLAAVGVIKGDDNGNFNAESNITRAEMAVIICKMAGMNEATANASMNIKPAFTDVEAGQWYTGWINLAVDNGIIAGFPDNTFRPNDPLTTNQAITLAVKALGKGAYVDQMGTWPGNYVQEAAKLGLTTEMVNTNSDLATRGNVAILAWEALQVGTWDVTSTTLEGEVRLSESDSLIIKYFKDNVAGSGKVGDEYRVKLVEDAYVSKVGKTSSDLGANQIVITKAADQSTRFDGAKTGSTSVATYIDADKKPNKGYKEATYELDDDVVAYVPAEVAKVDNLANKKIDVLFGADNEVVLLYVTEDTVDEAYVTAWDEKKITIAGETYKVNADAEVSVFDYVIAAEEDEAAIETITAIIDDVLEVADKEEIFNRALKADVVLDATDKVEKINFVFSVDGYTETTVDGEEILVEEGVVKSVSAAGTVKRLDGANFFAGAEIEDLMDEEETRVIKDGEVSDFDAIEEGDVITAISVDEVVTLVYVSSTKATGEITKIKNNTLAIDGNNYYTVLLPVADKNGDFDKAEVVADRDDVNDFAGEEVELYLNFLGEAVGVIGTTEGTGEILGVVNGAVTLKYDNDDVEYLSVRVLTADGKKASYKVYNKKSGKDITEADAPAGIAWEDDGIAAGSLIVFSADANKKIDSDDIKLVVATNLTDSDTTAATTYDIAGETGVEVIIPGTLSTEGKEKNKTITLNNAEGVEKIFKFNASTVTMNVDADTTDGDGLEDTEIVKNGWTAIIDSENTFADMDNVHIFYKGTKILYFVADFAEYMSSEAEYAMITDISYVENTDGDKVYEVTLFVDGETLTYELDDEELVTDIHEGDFVEYTLSDDKVDFIEFMAWSKAIERAEEYEDVFAFLNVVDNDGNDLSATIISALDNGEVSRGQLVVDAIEDGWIAYVDDAEITNPAYVDEATTPAEDKTIEADQLADVELCEDGYVIYDLSGKTPKMVEDINDIVGLHVIALELTEGDGAEIIIILK